MSYIITATIILWASIFSYFMPSAISKELDNKDNNVRVHIVEHTKEGGNNE